MTTHEARVRGVVRAIEMALALFDEGQLTFGELTFSTHRMMRSALGPHDHVRVESRESRVVIEWKGDGRG